jgi:hypothetical protein
VRFGERSAGQIDVQMPDGNVITSLSAARFEKVEMAEDGTRPEELDASNDD